MSSEKIVITVQNEKLPISKCKNFNKLWYKIGDTKIKDSGDCYLISNKYYRQETGLIVFNYSINEYMIKNDNLIEGIVEFVNNEPLFGNFEKNTSLPSITLENGMSYYILNYNSIENNKEYREHLGSGNFYHISKMAANKFNSLNIPRQEYKHSLPYDSKGITDKFINIYKENYKGEISPNIKKYAGMLGDLSFGLEFETTKGFIPDRILNQTGLIPLRDGSISGIEYVTIPLEGAKGLQTVVDLLKPLKERTTFNDTCSLHLHLGNIPRTKEFILAFFKLTCMVQDEIFAMFPIYKKYNFRIKNKNYSAPYPTFDLMSRMDPVINTNNINENFNILYTFLSEGQDFSEVNYDLKNVNFHPRDPEGTQKWNIHTRYFIHNLIPLIFGNKTTVEFRIHTPTYDVNKIIPFILINSILVNYVIENQKHILGNKSFFYKKTLYSIISEHLRSKVSDNGSLEDSIMDYLSIRKSITESQNGNGIIKGDEENIRSSKYLNWNQTNKEPSLLDIGIQYKSRGIGRDRGFNKASSFGTKAKTWMETPQYQNFDSLQQEIQEMNLRKKMQEVLIQPSYVDDFSVTSKQILENADNS